jgi:hypothetical protein
MLNRIFPDYSKLGKPGESHLSKDLNTDIRKVERSYQWSFSQAGRVAASSKR